MPDKIPIGTKMTFIAKTLLVACAFLIAFPAAASCESGVSFPLSALSKRRDPANIAPNEAILSYKRGDNVIIAYFKGVADGLTWAGAAQRAKGGVDLFCEPQVDFNSDLVVRALESYLKRVPANIMNGSHCGPLPSVILASLQDSFPCNAGR